MEHSAREWAKAAKVDTRRGDLCETEYEDKIHQNNTKTTVNRYPPGVMSHLEKTTNFRVFFLLQVDTQHHSTVLHVNPAAARLTAIQSSVCC